MVREEFSQDMENDFLRLPANYGLKVLFINKMEQKKDRWTGLHVWMFKNFKVDLLCKMYFLHIYVLPSGSLVCLETVQTLKKSFSHFSSIIKCFLLLLKDT